MGKLVGFFAAVSAKTWIHPQLKAELASVGETFELPGECFFKCTMDFAREDIRCAKHEEGSLEAQLCHETAENNFENAHDLGEISELDYIICMNKAGAEFEHCFDVCACDTPWCNCNPPSAMASPFDVVCYPQ